MDTRHWGSWAIGTALATCLVVLTGAPAQAASVSGDFVLSRTDDPAGSARWALGGTMEAERAVATDSGVGYPPGTLSDSDARYVTATLQAARQDPVVTACDEGADIRSYAGVASAASIFETDLVLNLLKGTGEATVGLAADPYGALDRMWAPGQTYVTDDPSTCAPFESDPQTSPVGVVGERAGDPDSIFDESVGRNLLSSAWPLVHGEDGAWRVQAARTVADRFGQENVEVRLEATFSGSPKSMHARCVTPTTKRLSGAHRVGQARAVLAEAGFSHVTVTKAKHTKAARKGHFYLSNLVGDRDPVPCGWKGIKLTRSLGWR